MALNKILKKGLRNASMIEVAAALAEAVDSHGYYLCDFTAYPVDERHVTLDRNNNWQLFDRGDHFEVFYRYDTPELTKVTALLNYMVHVKQVFRATAVSGSTSIIGE